jgi:4-alpha-glucanotransferase
MAGDREGGILLHPTSLAGDFGIGEIGPAAYAFAETLSAMGQGLWQVLPLGPTGYGDSPYQCLSTFAGNPLLISLEQLAADGLWSRAERAAFPRFPAGDVDYGAVIPPRQRALTAVCRRFAPRASRAHRRGLEAFCDEQAHWLGDYALFMALKEHHGLRPWTAWAPPLRDRDPAALREAARAHHTAIRHTRIRQYLFFDQWRRLRAHCHRHRVRLIGDLPIFVAHDSADVWANRALFHLREDGQPTVVAGVPPDYFSETGQRWGNPLYRWDLLEQTDYAWWTRRLRMTLSLVDVVRIDHFRGFEAYWEIPAEEPTAIHGRWIPGPGARVFDALRAQLGALPIIAEDLGLITEEVHALREACGFPGMRVLQFSFGGKRGDPLHWPDAFPPDCVCYTGTHDNDTTQGWFHARSGKGTTQSQAQIRRERRRLLKYLGTDGAEIHWDLIRVAAECPADTAIYPLQDVLGLGSDARMNTPGTIGGNWQWRLRHGQLTSHIQARLRQITQHAHRLPSPDRITP